MEDLTQRLECISLFGRLNLNTEDEPTKCRKQFSEILNFSPEKNDLDFVRTLDLPTECLAEHEHEVFAKIGSLKNLEFCVLKGGRRSKNGVQKGGLVKIPKSFGNLRFLSELDLSFNSFSNFPAILSENAALKTLNLDHNVLRNLNGISGLKNLQEITVRCNKLTEIPEEIAELEKLKFANFSSNFVKVLPDKIASFKFLEVFDLSGNLLKEIPVSMFSMGTLKKLNLCHNEIEFFPTFGDLSTSIELVDLRFNFIPKFPEKYFNDPRFYTKGNIPKVTDFEEQLDPNNDYDNLPEEIMNSDFNVWEISPRTGACFLLPSGVRIIFPRGFSEAPTEVFCSILDSASTDFKIHPMDQLLSAVLELSPSGILFKKPLLLTIPYKYESCDEQKREIIMRTSSYTDGGKYTQEDLSSTLIEETAASSQNSDESAFSCQRRGKVKAFVDHFSLFAVVARIIEDTAVIKQESGKLVSSVEPFTQLVFPENSVDSNTRVTIKVLSVPQSLLYDITKERTSYTTSILQVKVSPTTTIFNKDIKVHLSLPQMLMCRHFDKSQFRLLKCPCSSTEWQDVTNNIEMTFSQTDVKFNVNSFSKFWLVWRNVCGVARLVYHRLHTCKVQFIAMQKSSQPTSVFTQCVKSQYTQRTVAKLKQRGYFGDPACTQVKELTEGDQFKIKIIGDIRLDAHTDAYRKHLEEKVLIGRFHKQFHPDEDGYQSFPISAKNPKVTEVVHGHATFYQIIHPDCEESFLPSNPPIQQSSLKRSHNDSNGDVTEEHCDVTDASIQQQWNYLDGVLLSLECKTPMMLQDDKENKLNFGDLGEGVFRDSNLWGFAARIGSQWMEIGYVLGLSTSFMDMLKKDYPLNCKEQAFRMLRKWAQMHMNDNDCIQVFTKALTNAGRKDLADSFTQSFNDGHNNFKLSMKRRKLIDN